jgi:hypothetical protein
MKARSSEPVLLGWKEKVGLPAWGFTLRALMDPASPLSTLAVEHAAPLGRVRDAAGRRRLVLRLAVPVAQGRGRLKVVYAFYQRRTSLGEGLGRCCVIRTPLRLGELEWEGELALVPAERRQYFLHLGRGDLAGRFCLDPGRAYLHSASALDFTPEPSLPLPEAAPRG